MFLCEQGLPYAFQEQQKLSSKLESQLSGREIVGTETEVVGIELA